MSEHEPSPDTVYELFADSRRRELLVTLAAANEPLTIDELTTRVAANDSSDPSLPSHSHTDRARELAHIHLPKLADYNIIEYDSSAETITPTIPPQVEMMVQEMIDLADDF